MYAATTYNPARMAYRRLLASILLMGTFVTIGGCIYPGDLDQTVVGRYQRAMATKGAQDRGDSGLQPYQPEKFVGPELKIVVDEQTGRKQVFLSLNDAILRALANSLDIRVVSYDPSVSYEEMVQAAAEFDYVINGFVEYDRSDEESSIGAGPGPTDFVHSEVRTTTYQAGLSKKFITGAEAQLAWTLTRTRGAGAFQTLAEQYDNRIELEVTQPLLRGAWPEFNLATLKVARLNYASSIEEFRASVEEVITNVINAYWALVQARRDRAIRQALLDTTIETRERIDKRRAVDATDVELSQAESAVQTRQADLILSEQIVGDAQDQLVRLIGDEKLNLLSKYEVVPTTRPTSELVKIDETDQLLTALQYSPLLEQARLAIQIADVSVSVARTETLPQLDFRATMTAQGIGKAAHEARESMETGDFVGYSIGLLLEYPIGNRARIANYRAQKLSRLQAITALQNSADIVAQDVRNKIRRIVTAYKEMTAQSAAVVAARDWLDALEASEQLQRMSPEFLNVKLQAQETLALSARKELASLIAYNSALTDLARATGTVLELHGVQIAMPSVLAEGETSLTQIDNRSP